MCESTGQDKTGVKLCTLTHDFSYVLHASGKQYSSTPPSTHHKAMTYTITVDFMILGNIFSIIQHYFQFICKCYSAMNTTIRLDFQGCVTPLLECMYVQSSHCLVNVWDYMSVLKVEIFVRIQWNPTVHVIPAMDSPPFICVSTH